MKRKFDYKDVCIVPEVITKIDSRSEVSTLKSDYKLPFFVAPMDTVLDKKNYEYFKSFGLNICMPRGEEIYDGEVFNSFSLDDFIKKYLNEDDENVMYVYNKHNVHIDIANGHMYKLGKTISLAKEMYPNMNIMVGNIANPKTFKFLAECGADYVKVGIGGGSACITSTSTNIHYPYGSLVNEVRKIKEKYNIDTKIIADGGIKDFSDAITALALGADYVMMGGLFNKCIESCSNNYLFKYFRLPFKLSKFLFLNGLPIYKKYRGMSTPEVQKKWGRINLKTTEGLSKYNEVEYTLRDFVNKLNDYLKSAMSYTNSKNLDEFINQVEIINITNNARNRIN